MPGTKSETPEANAARPPRFPNAPERMRKLPVDHRGFPIPYFVAWINGRPDHRVVDPRKVEPAIANNICWLCGDPLGEDRAFVMGPLAAFNRVTTEPASHWDCGCFAASACPFLTQPRMRRNHKGLEKEPLTPPGGMLHHNPGVCVVWATPSFRRTVHRDGKTRLFELDQPTRVAWFSEGRPARRDEVLAAIEGCVAGFRGKVASAGPEAVRKLAEYEARALALAPAEG